MTERTDAGRSAQELVKLGRRLAYVLRHNPASVGVTLAEDGTALLDAVAVGMGCSVADLTAVVAADNKGRYSIVDGRVRAVQGHSVDVKVPMTVHVNPARVFHGAKVADLESILENGLMPGSRQHVHLSTTTDTAIAVAARRGGDSVIITVDVASALAEGVLFWRAENGVILCDHVPPHLLVEFTNT